MKGSGCAESLHDAMPLCADPDHGKCARCKRCFTCGDGRRLERIVREWAKSHPEAYGVQA